MGLKRGQRKREGGWVEAEARVKRETGVGGIVWHCSEGTEKSVAGLK